MLEVISHTPSRLIIGATVGALIAVLLAGLLGWHALRRLFNVPRVPRPKAMYVVLQAVGAGRVQVELTASPPAKGAPDPERYEIPGDSCLVSVVLVDLWPSLRILGPTRLWRVAGVGSQANARARPSVNPDWLTPRASQGLTPVDLLVHDARKVSLPVPAGGERFYLLASPDGPALEKAQS